MLNLITRYGGTIVGIAGFIVSTTLAIYHHDKYFNTFMFLAWGNLILAYLYWRRERYP